MTNDVKWDSNTDNIVRKANMRMELKEINFWGNLG